jgi:hypothetical protein
MSISKRCASDGFEALHDRKFTPLKVLSLFGITGSIA